MLFCFLCVKIATYHQLLNKKEGKDKNPSPCRKSFPQLTFRELEAFAGTRLTRFLSFHHTRVARKEASLFDGLFNVFANVSQRAGNRVAHGAGLGGYPTAYYFSFSIIFLIQIGQHQRGFYSRFRAFATAAVYFQRFRVNGNIALAFSQFNLGD